MEVLSPKYPGHIIICSSCGALLTYKDNDVYESTVYCPLCKQPTKIDYDKNYNGIVEKQEVKENNG